MPAITGRNTIVGIFRLDTSTLYNRQTLMAVAFRGYDYKYYSGQKGMQFFVNDTSQRVQVQLVSDYWGSNGIASLVLVANGGETFVLPGVDYFVAASWNDVSPTDDNVDMTIYLREVSDISGATAAFTSGTSVSKGAKDWSDQAVLVGYYTQDYTTGENVGTLDGNIDLLRIYADEFMSSSSDYDSLYKFVVLGEPYSCARAIDGGYQIAGDLNRDCYVNFNDLATFAQYWLGGMDPAKPRCTTP